MKNARNRQIEKLDEPRSSGYHSQLGHITPGPKPTYKITLHSAAKKETYTPLRTPSALLQRNPSMSESPENPTKQFPRNSSAMLKKPRD